MNGLLVVFSPASISAALVAGVTVGYAIVGAIAVNPRYASMTAAPRAVGLIVMWAGFIGGLAFFAGQAVATFVEGDPNWPRVISRFLLWISYAVALGIGAWYRVRRDERHRQARAHARAQRELDS